MPTDTKIKAILNIIRLGRKPNRNKSEAALLRHARRTVGQK